MITIEQELQDAVARDSRAPAFSVTIEDASVDYEEISGIDDSVYTIRKIVDAGSYYACIGYKRIQQEQGGRVYYRKMTSVTEASDWNAAWTSSFGTDNDGLRADRADIVVDGDNIFVAYYYNWYYNSDTTKLGNVKVRWSSDAGVSWSAELDPGGDAIDPEHVGDYDWVNPDPGYYYYHYEVVDVAFADSKNLFVVLRHRYTFETIVVHYHRYLDSSSAEEFFHESKAWDNGMYWHFPDFEWRLNPYGFSNYRLSTIQEGKRVFGFVDSSNDRQYYADKVLLLNTTVLSTNPADPTVLEFTKNRVYRSKLVYCPEESMVTGALFTMYEEALGGSIEEQDHQYSLAGPMTAIGDYFYTGIIEEYKSAADKDGFDTSYSFFMGKTKDGLSYEILPMDLLFGTDDPLAQYLGTKFYNFVAGMVVAENGTQICIPMGRTLIRDYDTAFKVYLCDYNSWFGNPGTQISVTNDVLSPINISRAVRAAASGDLELSNKENVYTDHAIVESGSRITIAAGYEGRLQDRFVGTLLGSSDTISLPKTKSFKFLDGLERASRVKQAKPHIIKGQNIFHLDFSDEADLDSMVIQAGVWEIQDGNLIQTIIDGNEKMILAGYEPDSAYLVETSFEFSGGMNDSRAGIAMRVNTIAAENYTAKYDWLVVFYSETYNRIEMWTLGERFDPSRPDLPVGLYRFNRLAYSSEIYMSEGSVIELAVSCRGGYITVLWRPPKDAEVTSRDDPSLSYNIAFCEKFGRFGTFEGYVGLFSELDEGEVQFHDLSIYSLFPAKTHSDAMKYLARVSGLDTDEVCAIDEIYIDSSGSEPSSRWDTSSRIGSWVKVYPAAPYRSGKFTTVYRWIGGSGEQWPDDKHLLIACDISATDVVVKANIDVEGIAYNSPYTCGGVFLRASSDLNNCYVGYIAANRAYICKRIDGSWSYLTSVPWPWTTEPRTLGDRGFIREEQRQTDSINVKFSARGPYLTLFVDDILVAWAYDTSLTDAGLVGMMAYIEQLDGLGALFRSFTVDGFYKPLDVVVVRPGDNAISVMNQLADMYDGGQFFCNENGALKWGAFNDTTVDWDTRRAMSDMSYSKNLDKVLTQIRVIGQDTYAEVRQIPWATQLGGHIYAEVSDDSIDVRSTATSRATSELENSKKILENSVELRGHPGLELCDNIGVARSPELDYSARRILGLNENISGPAYTMSLSQLETNEAQEP